MHRPFPRFTAFLIINWTFFNIYFWSFFYFSLSPQRNVTKILHLVVISVKFLGTRNYPWSSGAYIFIIFLFTFEDAFYSASAKFSQSPRSSCESFCSVVWPSMALYHSTLHWKPTMVNLMSRHYREYKYNFLFIYRMLMMFISLQIVNVIFFKVRLKVLRASLQLIILFASIFIGA